MRVMAAASEECAGFLRGLRERGRAPDPAVEAAVRAILDDVRERGDAAVLAHTERLDGVRLDAQALLTVEYTAFIWASLMGWLMFGEPLTVPTVIGAALIVIGCWIAARKHTEQTAL